MIGNGVVIDPWALLAEIETLRGAGGQRQPRKPGDRGEHVCLILPIHRELDQAREEARGGAKLGTTGRGIGPAYEDKVGRRAIRLCDLRDVETLRGAARPSCCCITTPLRRGFEIPDADATQLERDLLAIAPKPAALTPRRSGRCWLDARPAGGQAYPL